MKRIDPAAACDAALQAAEAGDDEAALVSLLEAWRATRADRLAELVDLVTARMKLPAIGASGAQIHPLWMAIAAEGCPSDLPRLLDGIIATARKSGTEVVAALHERIGALAGWPADPRTAAAAARLLKHGGYESTSSSTMPFWHALLELVIAHGDHRAIAIIATVKPSVIFRNFSDRARMKAWFETEVGASLGKLRGKHAAPPPKLAAALAKRCDQIDKALQRKGNGAAARRITDRDAALLAGGAAAKPERRAPTKIATTSPHAGMRTAEQAIERGDDDAALAALLDAWRADRSPAIAELVESVSKRFEARSATITGAKRDAIHVAWLAAAKRRRPADLPQLVATITETLGRSTHALERVKALATWPADPRTAAGIIRQLEHPPFYTSSTKPFWSALIRLVVDHGDPRAIEMLDGLSGSFRRILVSTYTDLRPITTWFERQVAAARDALAARYPDGLPKPDAATAAACTRIAAMLARATDRDDRLMAEILANPADDQPRVIYADYLQERDDPRGELIALQLSGADPDRVAALIAKHGRVWHGPLASVVDTSETRFERGFPSAMALHNDATPHALAGVTGEPTWATVRQLHVGYRDSLPAALIRHPIMRSLEHLGGLQALAAIELFTWKQIPFRSLQLDRADDAHDDAVLAKLAHAKPALAALRVLEIEGSWQRPADYAWLWSSWLPAQLERLAVPSGFERAAAWYVELDHYAPKLPALEIVDARRSRSSITFSRDPAGRLSIASAALRGKTTCTDLSKALALLPSDAIARLDVTTERAPQKPARAALERVCAKFRDLQLHFAR